MPLAIRSLSLSLLIVLLTAAPARADEVLLKNGDRFTGTTVSLAGGVLTMATPYGDVRIPWAEVTRLAIQDPILASVAGAPPAPVTIVVAADGQATLQPGGLVALADITSLARPQPAVIVNGGANAGIIATAGNTDVNNLRLDGDVVARANVNRYSASAAVTRAKDRGVETAQNWTTAFKYDRFVSTRMFLNANAIFTNDRFRDLDLRTAVGAGVGYQVLTGPRVTLTADGGLGYVNENLESPQPDDSYAALRESVSLAAFAIPDRIQFFHVHDGYFGVTGEDNLFVRMQNGVRLALAAGFVTTLRHDLDYDRSPAVGRSNTDRTFALTLGYRF
jgi:putative salt-induced outer membrane protein YdiY